MRYTAEEEYHYTGKLTGENAEKAIDAIELIDRVEDYKITIQEVLEQLPNEDVLSGVIKSLSILKKRVRGDNRDALEDIIEELDEIQSTQNDATEYAIDAAK